MMRWVWAATLAMMGCTDAGGSGGSGTDPDETSRGSEETPLDGTATLTIEGTDPDTDETRRETFEVDLALTTFLYSENEQSAVLFLGAAHAAGDGSSIEAAEVNADLFFDTVGEAPPTDALTFGTPTGADMVASFSLTVDGAMDGRVFLDELAVTSSSIVVSDFDTLSTSNQCLDADAAGPCDTALGSARLEVTLIAEDSSGGRVEFEVDGSISGGWSHLPN